MTDSRVEALLRALDRIIRRMQEAELRPSSNPHIPYDKQDLIEDVRALVAVRAALAGSPSMEPQHARALKIAQRLDDALLGATPPRSAADHELTALFEGAADTLRALAGAPPLSTEPASTPFFAPLDVRECRACDDMERKPWCFNCGACQQHCDRAPACLKGPEFALCVNLGARSLSRGAAELSDEERYLVEKARDLRAQGCEMVTTNHGVLLTYEAHGRLSRGAPEPSELLAAARALLMDCDWDAPPSIGALQRLAKAVENAAPAVSRGAPAPSRLYGVSYEQFVGFVCAEFMKRWRWETTPELLDTLRAAVRAAIGPDALRGTPAVPQGASAQRLLVVLRAIREEFQTTRQTELVDAAIALASPAVS